MFHYQSMGILLYSFDNSLTINRAIVQKLDQYDSLNEPILYYSVADSFSLSSFHNVYLFEIYSIPNRYVNGVLTPIWTFPSPVLSTWYTNSILNEALDNLLTQALLGSESHIREAYKLILLSINPNSVAQSSAKESILTTIQSVESNLSYNFSIK